MTSTRKTNHYYSSAEKRALREYFDLPLLTMLRQKKGKDLTYFGLPGSEALDIRTWQSIINRVIAVERKLESLEALEKLLDTQFPDVRYTTHLGDVDKVILDNTGNRRSIGGEYSQPLVGVSYDGGIENFKWHFDVVYLDYFGPFMPGDNGESTGKAQNRAKALRKLFETDRVDAWEPWVLLVTVNSRPYSNRMRSVLRNYLEDIKEDLSEDSRSALDFLLSENSSPEEEAVRLIHGSAAMLVSNAASNAGLETYPRGTVLYKGARDQDMVHLAFEFSPAEGLLGAPPNRATLLQAPILRPIGFSPWFELLPDQSPGTTQSSARKCLDFLDPVVLEKAVMPLS